MGKRMTPTAFIEAFAQDIPRRIQVNQLGGGMTLTNALNNSGDIGDIIPAPANVNANSEMGLASNLLSTLYRF